MYMSGLITSHNFKQRRPRRDEDDALLRSKSFKVRISDENDVKEIDVCQKAFRSLHGISRKRHENFQRSIKSNAGIAKDMRGKHTNRYN